MTNDDFFFSNNNNKKVVIITRTPVVEIRIGSVSYYQVWKETWLIMTGLYTLYTAEMLSNFLISQWWLIRSMVLRCLVFIIFFCPCVCVFTGWYATVARRANEEQAFQARTTSLQDECQWKWLCWTTTVDTVRHSTATAEKNEISRHFPTIMKWSEVNNNMLINENN